MREKYVIQTLEGSGAILRDTHAVYASGRHGNAYVNKDAVYPNVDVTSDLCRSLADAFAGEGVEVVVGPAIGGVILSQWTAFHIARDTTFAARVVRSVYAEKDGDALVIRRGYDLIVRDARTLVVEDVLTTGGSAKRAVDAARACGGEVIGVSALVNRGGVTAEDLGVPRLAALVDIDLTSWEASDCPLCKAGVPVNTDIGHGAAFMTSRNGAT